MTTLQIAFPARPAARPDAGQGGDEHTTERTVTVRERARAGANAGMRRISGR